MHSTYSLSNERGLTLVETLVMTLVISLVLIAVPASLKSGIGVWDRGSRHSELVQNALVGMEELTRELRQAKNIRAISPSGASNGFIDFRYEDDIGGYKYQRYEYNGTDDYLQYAWSDNEAVHLSSNLDLLAGPINSLTFTAYKEYTVDDEGDIVEQEATIPNEIKQVRAVHIKMVTYDDQGKVNPIPISARVYLRTWISHRMTDDFAIFGDDGVELGNQPLLVGAFSFDPSNVGSNADIIVGQHTTVNGNLHHGAGGDLIAQEHTYWHADYGYDEYILMPNMTIFSDSKWWDGADPAWDGADHTIDLGDVVIANSETLALAPGHYGTATFGNGSTLELTAGTYWFTSITAKNNDFLDFDVSGGDIRLFVDGIVDLGNTADASQSLIVDIEGGGMGIEGEGAANVYGETHYGLLEGEDDPAWTMGNNTIWYGGVYAPYGDIALYDGLIYGQLISAKTVTVHGGNPAKIDGKDTTEINFVLNNHMYEYGYE